MEPGTIIGHVHLKVADLERSIDFYRDVLGLEITQRYGSQAAFLAVPGSGYHHHIGLNTWHSHWAAPPAENTTGLYHVALLYPTRRSLADALQRLLAHGIKLDGASDHGVSEALYLHDPDYNGLELYWDRPRDQWPRDSAGNITMYTRSLNLEHLMRESSPDPRKTTGDDRP